MGSFRVCAVALAFAVGLAGCKVGVGARRPADPPVSEGLSVVLEGPGVETLDHGSSRIAGHGHAPFGVLVTTKVLRHPYPGETLSAVVTSGERVVTQVPFSFDARFGRARVQLPSPGNYRVEIWGKHGFVTGNTFVAASLPRLDGQRALELHPDAAPRLVIAPGHAPRVRWQHWDTIDADTGFVAEWWHDGTRVTAPGGRRSELQRKELLQLQITRDAKTFASTAAWRWTTDELEAPEDLLARPGAWELRLYRDDKAPLALGFTVTPTRQIRGAQRQTIGTVHAGTVELDVAAAPASKDATKELARLPRTRFEASKKYLLPVTVAEVRALTRSEVLRAHRLRLNRLERHKLATPAADLAFTDGSPDDAEAKKLAQTMQKMIASLGGPWSEDERP